MTRNEIFDMACEFYTYGGVSEREVAFARFVMAREREECAKLLDEMAAQDKLTNYYAVAANAIRARVGEK